MHVQPKLFLNLHNFLRLDSKLLEFLFTKKCHITTKRKITKRHFGVVKPVKAQGIMCVSYYAMHAFSAKSVLSVFAKYRHFCLKNGKKRPELGPNQSLLTWDLTWARYQNPKPNSRPEKWTRAIPTSSYLSALMYLFTIDFSIFYFSVQLAFNWIVLRYIQFIIT